MSSLHYRCVICHVEQGTELGQPVPDTGPYPVWRCCDAEAQACADRFEKLSPEQWIASRP